jgi:hypothetical protein
VKNGNLETYVKDRFGVGLCTYLEQKVEEDNLHDYEIASTLNVCGASISKYRKACGLKKANGFSRRFERTYGDGAVETFKKIIENPDNYLADVGRHFDFTREYARQVYKKIYGHPYTVDSKNQQLQRQKTRLARTRRKSKRVEQLIKVGEKIQSIGVTYNLPDRGRSNMILANGYRLGLRRSSKPILIRKMQYFRFNNGTRTNKHFDFFVCLCRTKKGDVYFIIPSSVMPRTVVYLLPERTATQSKYAQFKEAWHLLMHENSKEIPLLLIGSN